LAIEKVKAILKHLRILHIFGHMLEPSEKIRLFFKDQKKKNMFLVILRKTNP